MHGKSNDVVGKEFWMKKEDKAIAVADLHERFSKARFAVVTECGGMPVNQVTQLRHQLHGAKAELSLIHI